MPMTRAFRDLWLQRCTDGSYQQTTSVLVEANNDKERCCLGVAHAVGKELGLLPPDAVLHGNSEDEEYLPDEEAVKLGIDNQPEFANANDRNRVPEGQYYPAEVLDMIKNHPVID